MQTYAIGDIHGQRELLEAAHDRIAADRAAHGDEDAPVIHLGDLTDRGPDSRGVIERLIAADADPRWHVIMGNHDRMMAHFLRPRSARDPLRDDLNWLAPPLGGRATLASYGVDVDERRSAAEIHADAIEAVPEAHRTFLDGLPTRIVRGEAFYCHAGVRPGIPLADQVEDDLVWIREPFLSDPMEHGALIVHGHTPVKAATHYGNRLDLDTGAAYGGPLSVAVIEGRRAWLVTERGREELRPVA
ncbi:metallophosphoesterase [Tropicimonas sp. IMCC34011]|uniref:metallophosphoesterase n=1 Tax=Tropicimonas sp. IMCC34011 TaxID=2248759 RepID=UPI000E27FC56|nr:metallophosphoesterase [Tropicimonas sp. IMCC34011]